MGISYTKQIHGFKIRIGSGRRKSAKKPPKKTQRAKTDHSAFLNKINQEAYQLLDAFLADHYINITYARRKRLDLDNLFANTPANEGYQHIKKTLCSTKEIVEKVQYAGQLTAKRKDKLVDNVFSMKKMIATEPKGLHTLALKLTKKYRLLSICCVSVSVLTCWLLFIQHQADSRSIISACILGIVCYLPIHFILKFIRKFNYYIKSVQLMKQHYAL